MQRPNAALGIWRETCLVELLRGGILCRHCQETFAWLLSCCGSLRDLLHSVLDEAFLLTQKKQPLVILAAAVPPPFI